MKLEIVQLIQQVLITMFMLDMLIYEIHLLLEAQILCDKLQMHL